MNYDLTLNYSQVPHAPFDYLWHCRYDCAPAGSICLFELVMDRSSPMSRLLFILHHEASPERYTASAPSIPQRIGEIVDTDDEPADLVGWFRTEGWHVFQAGPEVIPGPASLVPARYFVRACRMTRQEQEWLADRTRDEQAATARLVAAEKKELD